MKKTLLLASAIGLMTVTGCANSNVAGNAAPQLTFQNYQPITLNVQSATVEEAYLNANDPKDVSAQFVVSPAEAVKRYAAQRFKAQGMGNGFFTIAIEDSRVYLRQIPQQNKVLAWADAGTEDEYRVLLQLRVTPQPDGFNGRIGATTIRMDRTLIMRSGVTLAEREMKQIQFLEQLIADVDARINEALNAVPAIK
jgi:hypothetical protein